MLSFVLTFVGFIICDAVLIALLAWAIFRYSIHSLKFPIMSIGVGLSGVIVMIADGILIFTHFKFNKIAIVLCIVLIFIYLRSQWLDLIIEEFDSFEKYAKKVEKEYPEKVAEIIKNKGEPPKNEFKDKVSETFGEESGDYVDAFGNLFEAMKQEDDS